jgi:hypothetical protein
MRRFEAIIRNGFTSVTFAADRKCARKATTASSASAAFGRSVRRRPRVAVLARRSRPALQRRAARSPSYLLVVPAYPLGDRMPLVIRAHLRLVA